MRRSITLRKKLPGLLLVLLSLVYFTTPAFAHLNSFTSGLTTITTSEQNHLNYHGYITIAGTSQLEQIWLCVRGPKGEIAYYPLEVNKNSFQYELCLRFGPGTYTIWVGDAAQYFDGKIRFNVTNTLNTDWRYLAPSTYIDSNHEVVTELANSLLEVKMTDYEKLEAIYHWVTGNICYDYRAYEDRNAALKPASVIIQDKKGLCRDYSFALAALARAAGLESRVIYGQARHSDNNPGGEHAWNEIYLNDGWISVDATWDAGSPQYNYFNPKPQEFAQTHQAETITLY